jgi:hypothetical protein
MKKKNNKIRQCKMCRKDLLPRHEKYCSNKCHGLDRKDVPCDEKVKIKIRKTLIKTLNKDREKRYCFACGKETKNKKYCNKICTAKGRIKEKAIRECNFCGKGTTNKTYCSRPCEYADRKIIYCGDKHPFFGKHHTLETRNILNIKQSNNWLDPEYSENQREALKEAMNTELVKENCKKGSEKRWLKVEEHILQSERITKVNKEHPELAEQHSRDIK